MISEADLFLFMGQSNMAGRGTVNEIWKELPPRVIDGAGFEFRAFSEPSKLWAIEEPFGYYEDNENGINDRGKKSGSLVSAFVNAYYETCGVPVVGVSASEGGTSITEWQPGTGRFADAEARLKCARAFLEAERIRVRHIFVLWCQGETDGDKGCTAEEYTQYFLNMWSELEKDGIEKCFVIQIGEYNGEGRTYADIRKAQEELPKRKSNIFVVSEQFAGMRKRGLMRDCFHYYQAAYNEVGTEAGKRAAVIADTV